MNEFLNGTSAKAKGNGSSLKAKGPSKVLKPKDSRYFNEDKKCDALRLPSILGMNIIYSGFRTFLLQYGVYVKEKNFEFQSAKNNMNNYIRKQVRRLKKLAAAGEYRAFWTLWLRIVSRSVSFGFLALHKVFPRWYKEMSLKSVLSMMKKFYVIRRHLKTNYRVTEREVPKPNGKMRTLSVPEKHWRLYLYLINLGLHIFVNPRLNDNQFGHRAGFGVMKCWSLILRTLKDWNFIYEFDFKAFHPSISFVLIRKSLLSFNVPTDVVNWLMKLNDPRVITVEGKTIRRGKGVPQGVATSAILGMMVLEYLKIYNLKNGTYVGFADDGIIGGNSPESVNELKEKLTAESGIEVNEEKSGWVLFEGQWMKPLKFLGAEYFGDTELFKSSSRSGITEEFTIGGSSNPEWVETEWGEGKYQNKKVIGGPKWWSQEFRDYAAEHNEIPALETNEKPALTWKEALELNNGMNLLMGSVWCSNSIIGSRELTFNKDSLIGLMSAEESKRGVRRSEFNLSNASSKAFKELNNLFKRGNAFGPAAQDDELHGD